MTSEWLSGAFTALGAILGTGVTLATGLIGNRTQRELAEASRKAQIADARREAYTEYLTAVYSFMDSARGLIAALDENDDITEFDDVHRAYLEDWVNLHFKYAPVLIAGPGQIEESAQSLRHCLGNWQINATGGMKLERTVIDSVIRRRFLMHRSQPRALGLNFPQPLGITYTAELFVVSPIKFARRHERTSLSRRR